MEGPLFVGSKDVDFLEILKRQIEANLKAHEVVPGTSLYGAGLRNSSARANWRLPSANVRFER